MIIFKKETKGLDEVGNSNNICVLIQQLIDTKVLLPIQIMIY